MICELCGEGQVTLFLSNEGHYPSAYYECDECECQYADGKVAAWNVLMKKMEDNKMTLFELIMRELDNNPDGVCAENSYVKDEVWIGLDLLESGRYRPHYQSMNSLSQDELRQLHEKLGQMWQEKQRQEDAYWANELRKKLEQCVR